MTNLSLDLKGELGAQGSCCKVLKKGLLYVVLSYFTRNIISIIQTHDLDYMTTTLPLQWQTYSWITRRKQYH